MKIAWRPTLLTRWSRRPFLASALALMVAIAAVTGLFVGPLRARNGRRPLRVTDLSARQPGSAVLGSGGAQGPTRVAGSTGKAAASDAVGVEGGAGALAKVGKAVTTRRATRAAISVSKPGHGHHGLAGRIDHPLGAVQAPGAREISRHFEFGYGPTLTPAEQLSVLTGVPSGWSKTWHSIKVGSLTRQYLMVRPPVTSKKIPVLVVLHGRWSDPAIIERVTHFTGVVGKAILVYPAGYMDSWDAGGCCGRAYRAGINDVGFVSDVVNQVRSTQSDAGKVYLSGFSDGGRLAYRVACDRPGMFAGFAAVEAVPVIGCTPAAPIPVEIVARTGDPLLTVDRGAPPKVVEGTVEPTVQTVVSKWRAIDGCSNAATTTAHGIATITTWANCRGGSRVQFCLYRAVGHLWTPGGGTTPSAQSVVWDFLRRRPVSVPA